MEKKFHLFVRRHASGGYTASVLSQGHLASFSDDVEAARSDVATVLGRLLSRDPYGLGAEVTHWPGLTLRRLDLQVRALQHGRLLTVPMRFTVLVHPNVDAAAYYGDEPQGRGHRDTGPAGKGYVVHVPRLGLSGRIDDVADLEAFVEERVRHALYMVPIERLLAAAYDGEENVETLTVTYKARGVTPTKRDEGRRGKHETPAGLRDACRDLTDEALAGVLDRAQGRDADLTQLVGTISSATQRASVMLVGPSGVGKTALVYELAARAIEANAGAPAHGIEVYSTSGSRLLAGMRYLGQWQLRVQKMIDELRTRKAVLHIDSLSELLSVLSGMSGLDPARYLQPSIENGEITVICEATADDIARAERTHPAFVRAFRTMPMHPLYGDFAQRALEQVATRLGRARRVRFNPEAIVRATELAERFGDGSAMPGSAAILLRAAAYAEPETAAERAQALDDHGPARELGPDHITAAFAVRTGYPREIIDPNTPLDPDAVLATLRSRVVGQDNAMVLLRDLVVTLKTGLSDPSRPLGSFLFLGPTGVGKTESALSLAAYLFGDPKRMARFDMSEYAAPGSASMLVNDRGGEGVLTRRVREQPFGVVLFDEVEKADPGVHDLLLQILGEGRLTDGTGRTVSFRNTVVVLTSNLGADTAGRSLGFGGGAAQRNPEAHYVSAAAAFFRPELLNRIDHIAPFLPLAEATVHEIARKAVVSALAREGLTRRGVRVRYDEAVVARIASLGFDARYGARPLKRAVERWIVGPVARVLAARGREAPAELELVCRGDGIAVAPTSAHEVQALAADAVREELSRRAESARSRGDVTKSSDSSNEVALTFVSEGPRARKRARWLAEGYASWAREHGAVARVDEPAELRGAGLVLRASGGPVALLPLLHGVYEFDEHQPAAPNTVTAGATSATTTVSAPEHDAARVFVYAGERAPTQLATKGAAEHEVEAMPTVLFSQSPAPAALDVESGYEHLGPWDAALAPHVLDRFVLARAATHGATAQ